jgi:hypothetical protein
MQFCAVGHIFQQISGLYCFQESEADMNHSMRSADSWTHLKVVAVGFLCAFFVLIVGRSAHVAQIDLGPAPLVKTGGPSIVSGQLPTIR